MVLYNTSWMDNTTSPLDIVSGIGTSMGNEFLIGNLILLSFAFVFMIFAYKHDWREVLMLDAFITTILAILFAFAGLVSFVTVIYPAIAFFLVMIIYFMT